MISTGTGSDFVRTAGIPRDAMEAARHLAQQIEEIGGDPVEKCVGVIQKTRMVFKMHLNIFRSPEGIIHIGVDRQSLFRPAQAFFSP